MQYALRNALDVCCMPFGTWHCGPTSDIGIDLMQKGRWKGEISWWRASFVVFGRIFGESMLVASEIDEKIWSRGGGELIEQDWEQSGFMPAQKYHCDYCDKQFYDTKKSRERHLQGVSHLRAKKLWFDSFRGAITNFFCLPCAFLVCSMDMPFHIKQRCSLLSRST